MGGRATIAVGTVAVAAALSGCYGPHPSAGAPCDLALDNCPSSQRCLATAEGSFCYATDPGTKPDAPGPGDPDGPRPDNAPNCYGTGLVHDLCALAPTNDIVVSANRVINTAMVGGTNCDSIIAGGGASLCLIAARTISIGNGIKLSATGPNPLVLVGTQSVTINGALDVASHVQGGSVIGPGAQTSCGAGNAGSMGGNPDAAGGGGAGGSFGGKGADGGLGKKSSTNNPGGAPGTALAAGVPTSLVGGCPGGDGGPGHGGGGVGGGGAGGGAVYIISAGSITISGSIDASGAGGGAGAAGVDSSGGAGGGGSGGFIGLDTPSLMVTGSVFANGAGGGGGGGDMPTRIGNPGNDPVAATTQANGGVGGTGGGGDGGKGYAGALAPTTGNPGINGYCAGGGGGGGAGIIKIYGTTASGGTFSPTPI